MTDSGSNEKKGTGFAGLDAMVSDVSEDVEKAANAITHKASAPDPLPSEPSSQSAKPERRPTPAESSPSGSGMSGLGWVVVGIIVLVIWIANSGSGNKNQSTPSYSPPTSYSDPVPAPRAPAPTVAPVSDEQKPPVGRDNILNIAQIRWCKRESIRVKAIESVINDTYDHEVSRFNAKVSEYNSRCGEFRYRRGNVEQVDREIASERESIESKAKSDWVRQSLGLDAPKKPSKQSKANMETQAAKPKQSETKTKDAQPACSQDKECPGALFCVRGACGKQVDLGGLCNRDIECGPAGSTCVSGRCAAASSSAPSLSPSNLKPSAPTAPEQPKRNGGMPANAELDYSGNDWRCKQGYRKSGNECLAVAIPANAELDYSGHDWRCKQGYRKSGNECLAVAIPANAELDYSGNDWRCKQGYKKIGYECRPL